MEGTSLMRISASINGEAYPKPESITDLVIVMDNGERYLISESRPSASQCELVIVTGALIKVMPVDKHTVRLGRE